MDYRELSLHVLRLLPEDELRPVPVRLIAHSLAARVDSSRWDGNTVAQAVEDFLDEWSFQPPDGLTAQSIADEIMVLVFADEHHDSELQQAQRASTTVLRKYMGASKKLSGWVPGYVATTIFGRAELTGNPCPRCAVNPECYGDGGGTRCLDRVGCGWWDCA